MRFQLSPPADKNIVVRRSGTGKATFSEFALWLRGKEQPEKEALGAPCRTLHRLLMLLVTWWLLCLQGHNGNWPGIQSTAAITFHCGSKHSVVEEMDFYP